MVDIRRPSAGAIDLICVACGRLIREGCEAFVDLDAETVERCDLGGFETDKGFPISTECLARLNDVEDD